MAISCLLMVSVESDGFLCFQKTLNSLFGSVPFLTLMFIFAFVFSFMFVFMFTSHLEVEVVESFWKCSFSDPRARVFIRNKAWRIAWIVE